MLPGKLKVIACSALGAIAVAATAAWADETSPTSPTESENTAKQTAPATENAAQPAATSSEQAPSAGSAAGSDVKTEPAASAAPTPDWVEPYAGEGPLLDKRKALLNRIRAAKKQGIGIGAYMGEFNRIEGLVKDGQPPSAYESRLDSLSSNLDEQLKRSQQLKTQRPIMTAAPSAPPPPVALSQPMSPPPAATGPGGMSADQVMDIVKSRMGNKVPSGLGALDKLSPQQKQQLMQSDMAKQLMKKYLGGGN